MKYWGYLAAKLFAAAALLSAIWPIVRMLIMPKLAVKPTDPIFLQLEAMREEVVYNIAVFAFALLGAGLLYLIIIDQRYRCRTCLRKLRMPIARGSWNGSLLLGRPHTEYICLYGHGTLKVPELQIAGKEPIDWSENQDIWKELELLDTTKR